MPKRVLVLGAGPAGLMAAIQAARAGAQVTVLEKMPTCGKKLCITGKGRCNVTNAADLMEILQNIPGNGKFLHSALRAFDNQAVMQFFESEGVPLKIERGQRVFPESDKAQDILDALLRALRKAGAQVRTHAAAVEILVQDNFVRGVRLADGKVLHAGAVILATGGASYPKTGSNGEGYALAWRTGHTIVPLTPALVPLEVVEDWPKTLPGLSLRNVRLTLQVNHKAVASEFGEMLFTHFGISGPIVLSLSRTAALALRDEKQVTCILNLKPALSPEQLEARVQRDFQAYAKKEIQNGMHDLLPKNLIVPVLQAAGISLKKFVHQITRKERLQIVQTLQNLPLTIAKTRPLAEAIVTVGGVSTREIMPKTMESKKVQGLFFAGEVVDVDGFTGGYNLQAAFAMGAAAGRAVGV